MPEIDLNAFREEFEATYVEEETPNIEQADQLETDNIEEDIELGELEPEEELESPEQSELDADTDPVVEEKPVQSPEDNAAFAEMRRKNEELARQAKVAEQVAAQYGMTVDQFEKAYADQQLQQRAEQQGVPLDVLKRLEAAETELSSTRFQSEQDKFWSSVETTKAKLGLNDDEVKATFEYIGQRGLVNVNSKLPTIPFEDAYKAANFDSILERSKKEDNQKRLADKKARQKKSAVPHTNAGTQPNEGETELSVDDVEKRLKERGLI